MPKESGLGWTKLDVDEQASPFAAKDIMGDITNLDISIPRGSQDVTGLDQSAMDRLQLLADAQIGMNGVFNDASDKSHKILSTLSGTGLTDTIRTITATISGQSLPGEYFLQDYILTRAASGEFTWSTPAVLTGGVIPTWA